MHGFRLPSQRDVMRGLFKAHGGDRAAAVAAYASAERAGRVLRSKNRLGWDADRYAAELWRDGVRKGWIA